MSSDQLELGGAQLTVTSLIDVYAGLDRESCRPKAVRVSGIDSHTSKEFLLLFFKNRLSCGGGKIDDLEYDEDEGIAVVTFKDAECELWIHLRDVEQAALKGCSTTSYSCHI